MKKRITLFAILCSLCSIYVTAQNINLDKWIEIIGSENDEIKFKCSSDKNGTHIKIERGLYVDMVTIGTDWSPKITIPVSGSTVKIYGDITGFDCSENYAKLNKLNVKNNADLTVLACDHNSLYELDVTANTKLQELYCWKNQITNLDLSKNTLLEELECDHNSISELDLRNNTELTRLECTFNELPTLDLRNNEKLTEVHCYSNKMYACGIDDLYSNLPEKELGENAKIYIKNDNLSFEENNPGQDVSNHTIATAKNWNVLDFKGSTELNNTYFQCEDTNEYWIELTVTEDALISNLLLSGKEDNNLITFKSGDKTKEFMINKSMTVIEPFKASGTSIKIFGQIKQFGCNLNGELFTGVDVTNNPLLTMIGIVESAVDAIDLSKSENLEIFICPKNRFSSLDFSNCPVIKTIECTNNMLDACALDDLYHSLPQAVNYSSPAIFVKSLSQNPSEQNPGADGSRFSIARDKGWRVLDSNSSPIANTTFDCNEDQNMAIKFTVADDAYIEVKLQADKENSPIKIVNGHEVEEMTIGTELTSVNISATTDSIIIYGDITILDCSDNDLDILAIDISKNTLLKSLNCSENDISELDISKNINLNFLDCSMNTIETIDLSQNKNLEGIECWGNKFSQIDFSKNIALKRISCGDNPIYSIDVSKNINLISLECISAKLSQLDVSKNILLETLHCWDNSISTLALDKNIALQELLCNVNLLKEIDLSKNPALKKMSCHENQISTLNFSNNPVIADINCSGNLLTACELDNMYKTLPTHSDTLKGLLVIKNSYIFDDKDNPGKDASRHMIATAKNWKVVDYKYNQAVVNTNFDCEENEETLPWIELTVTENATLNDLVFLADSPTKINIISGSINQEVAVGASMNNIIPVNFTASGTSIIIKGNINAFGCSENGEKITGLDVSNNPLLIMLGCLDNNISTLDLTKNVALELLNFSKNNLSHIDLSMNINLIDLDCFSNKLTKLDLSNNKKLEDINCSGNIMTACALDSLYESLPTRTGMRGKLIIKNSFFTDENDNPGKDGSRHAIATEKNWDVIDYNNSAVNNTNFDCEENEEILPWIELTVTENATLNDLVFLADSPTKINIISGSINQEVAVGSNMNNIIPVNFTASGTSIIIKGNLNAFGCSENGEKITGLDVSNNPLLTMLGCLDNNISTLDLTKNVALQLLNFSKNNLSHIDLSMNINLIDLDCFSNKLTKLDLSTNKKLEDINCSGNLMTACALDSLYESLPTRTGMPAKLIIKNSFFTDENDNPGKDGSRHTIATEKNWDVIDYNNSAVNNTNFDCEENEETLPWIELTVTENATLNDLVFLADSPTNINIISGSINQEVAVGANMNNITPVNFTASGTSIIIKGNLNAFGCSENGEKITGLDVSNNPLLTMLGCLDNNISTLDLTKNVALELLNCSENNLSHIDLSMNINLIELDCYGNKLTKLDLSTNKKLEDIDCSGNLMTACALDSLYESLPTRTGTTGKLIIKNSLFTNENDNPGKDGSRHTIATEKNWNVIDYNNSAVNNTNFDCEENEEILPWIELTVTENATLNNLVFLAKVPTTINIISGSINQEVTVESNINNVTPINFTASGTSVKIKGDIIAFGCSNNEKKITDIDIRNNPNLLMLNCVNNSISALDLTENSALILLMCSKNNLTELNVSKNINLIDIDCFSNKLTKLDLSNNKKLEQINCSGNLMTACDLDYLYESLPKRSGVTGKLVIKNPLFTNDNPGKDGSRHTIATEKNWNVIDVNNNAINNTNFDCVVAINDIEYDNLTTQVYPNPASETLYINSDRQIEKVTIYNIAGSVLIENNINGFLTQEINISSLHSGIYIVKVKTDERVYTHKIIKQ